MLEMVENPNKGGSTEVHSVFVVCAGQPTRNKVLVANAMAVDWQLSLKRKMLKKMNVLGTNRQVKVLISVCFSAIWRNITTGR